MKKIMLDAGHYSYYNQSCVYPNYFEGNMTWKLQNYLKEELEKYGFEVDTTRSKRDNDLSVYNRGLKAKGYDLFLSLHSNAAGTTSVDRVVVIKRLDNKEDELGKMLASTIDNAMEVKQDYQIYTRKTSSGGEYYGVLRGAKDAKCMQAYILEHSFHTNFYSAMWLSKDTNLQKLARAEAETIAKFYGITKEEFKFENGEYNKNVKVKCNSRLNVRENRPNVFGKLAPQIEGFYLYPDDVVTLGYVYNNWGGIYTKDGRHGFVNCNYLELAD